MENNLRQAHGTRAALTDRASVQNFLERSENGHVVPTREAFDLMRKNQTPEDFLKAVKTRYKDSKMTLDDARDFTASHHFADKFNPSILNETREVVSLTKAKHGGMSADFCGLGSANTHGTACAIAGAANRDQAIGSARVAEQKVTEEFQRKIARYKQLMGDAAKCSGDDCVTIAQGRAWTRSEKQERLNRLNSDPLTRDMRIGFVGDKVVREEDINQLATHAESIEKLMRGHFEGKIPYARSKEMTFAVDMDAKALGDGSASWLSGVAGKPLSAEEKRLIDEAFSEAVMDMNTSLSKKGGKGSYQVAP
ncbi:MAG: hypothetical protein EOP06_26875 [Proteobacteria bacterium]|nr:MAG: hypothetical protein EOP06_26875 [Pseudomonadota bacterium]